MQESLNLYRVLSGACSEKEIDIVEIKDHFEVMGKAKASDTHLNRMIFL